MNATRYRLSASARLGAALLVTTLGLANVATAQMVDLECLGIAPSGYGMSVAQVINNAGQIAGYSRVFNSSGSSMGTHPFMWQNGVMIDLGTIGSLPWGESNGSVADINELGQVVGTSTANGGAYHAWIWQNGQMVDLGFLGTSSGLTYSYARAINDAGQVVGMADAYDANRNFKGQHAFIWQNGVMADLGVLGTNTAGQGWSEAIAINNAGQVIGQSTVFDADGNPKGVHAFLWQDGQMMDLGALETSSGGWSESRAVDINESGQIVGISVRFGTQGRGNRAVLWQNGQMTDLGTLGSSATGTGYSVATAINNAGQVIGGSSIYDAAGTNLGFDGFLWQNGQMVPLVGISPTAINELGQVIGTNAVFEPTGWHAFRWQNGTKTDLGAFGVTPWGWCETHPMAINDSGLIAGSSYTWDGETDRGIRAFLYDQSL